LKSTETAAILHVACTISNFSNFGSLKSTETMRIRIESPLSISAFQQFRLVEEH